MWSITLPILLFGIFCQSVSATVTTYPFQDSVFDKSTQFEVKADDKSVTVVKYHDYDFAHFSMDGTVKVTITKLGSNINSHTITPQKLGIDAKAKVSRATMSFDLTENHYLIIKIDDRKPLVILADPPEQKDFSRTSKGVIDVTKAPYNADSSGREYASNRVGKPSSGIQKALNDAFDRNGAIVYVPAGVYKTGNLVIGPKTHLYLEGGAVLTYTGDAAYYQQWWKKSSRVFTYWIRTTQFSSDIKISGRGIFYGDGKKVFDTNKSGMGATIMAPMNTYNFNYDGPILMESSFWTFHLQLSTKVNIKNLKILNRLDMGENDGLDVNESENVRVKNAIAITWDDCFSTKTYNPGTPDEDVFHALKGTKKATKDVIFEDLVAWTGLYGLKMGQGAFMNHENIEFRNAAIYDCSCAIGIDHRWGAAAVKGALFKDVDVERVTWSVSRRTWLAFNIEFAQKWGTGPVSDIRVEDVTIRDFGTTPAEIQGYDEDGKDD
ncbi:glycoside hydrolase family 28 protein [Aulographum hederae CBS 113979]|uniref:Glycoside hydrolase family 28 protein n=1 Tax=Aulographum hederae CBS 113979 TaxID=1176131 RepID=A0A6G1GTJ0_9PEZI|nr:glycoside hydrolase family 28 protein [Aulographum hederae CBS 113979]